jgi:hypothetical protein
MKQVMSRLMAEVYSKTQIHVSSHSSPMSIVKARAYHKETLGKRDGANPEASPPWDRSLCQITPDGYGEHLSHLDRGGFPGPLAKRGICSDRTSGVSGCSFSWASETDIVHSHPTNWQHWNFRAIEKFRNAFKNDWSDWLNKYEKVPGMVPGRSTRQWNFKRRR